MSAEADDPSELQGVQQELLELPRSVRPSIYALPSNREELRDSIVELFAVAEALSSTPELEGDPVARRELQERRSAAQENLQSLISRAYGLGGSNPDAQWFHAGEALSLGRRPSATASGIFDEVYKKAPTLKNELVNRHELSSAASGARRALMELMIDAPNAERLGLTGHPPELSMYLSILQATGLHVQSGNEWKLVAPADGSPLAALWSHLGVLIHEAKENRLTLQHLMYLLALPPYGVRRGVAPILILAYYLVNQDKLFLYEENSLLPAIGSDLVHRMVRRPATIEFQSADAGGQTQLWVDGLATRMFPGKSDVSLLQVVKSVVRVVNKLSPYASVTQEVSQVARRVRSAVKAARDPHRLFLISLPEAVGMVSLLAHDPTPEHCDEFSSRLVAALAELQKADDVLLTDLDHTLRKLLGSVNGEFAFYRRMADRAQRLERSALRMQPTLSRLVSLTAAMEGSEVDEQEIWLQGVATAIIGKPTSMWRDQDHVDFGYKALSVCRSFRQTEELAVELGRLPTGAVKMMRVSVMDDAGSEHAGVVADVPELKEKLAAFLKDIQKVAENHHLDREDMAYAVIANMLELAAPKVQA